MWLCVSVTFESFLPVGGSLVEFVHAAPHGTNVFVDLSHSDVPEVAGLLSPQQVIDLEGSKEGGKERMTQGRKEEREKNDARKE